MTLLLPNSTFLHIPRTGGTWVRKVLGENGLIVEELRSTERSQSSENSLHSWHMIPPKIEKGFCFVRHPATWYQSYWCYKWQTNSWNRNNPFDAQCRDENFNDFVEKSLRSYPQGYVALIYEFYTTHADFVGLQENLTSDLIAALNWVGEDYKLDKIVSARKENVSKQQWKQLARFEPEMLRRVLEAEASLIEKYGYTQYLPPVFWL